jgi:hypothetical protein
MLLLLQRLLLLLLLRLLLQCRRASKCCCCQCSCCSNSLLLLLLLCVLEGLPGLCVFVGVCKGPQVQPGPHQYGAALRIQACGQEMGGEGSR